MCIRDRIVERDTVSKANALGISEEEALGHTMANGVVQLEDDSKKADTLYCLEVLLISKTDAEVQAEQEVAASRLASPTKPTEAPVDSSVRKLSLIHISEPTRLLSISYAVFCLKKKN
eukprot:TRINITY_DN41742_c0_g1_i1.p1 TRINITY_DN41742_c0_g1~~TRINITY_DN41742_c0_g1_i1.p1  ORF type:complete len:118 (+),score=42.34 TRINITY_DN41742_c0_g1_i1:157-510(+)